MALNEVDICNLALQAIRVFPIESLSDQSPAARACARSYDVARDAALGSYAWNFAEKESELAVAAGETAVGWTYVYAIPSDFIGATKIYNAADDSTKIEFAIRADTAGNAKRILTNHINAVLIYTARIENENMFSPEFVDAFVARLAIDLSPLRSDPQLKLQLQQAYTLLVSQAKETNANEGEKMPVNDDLFIQAR